MVKIKTKQQIPDLSGVYLFKDKHKKIIYIGKAKSLKKRIKSYFNKESIDWKTDFLLQEYDHIDWIITQTEQEALLLEASLIKDNQPKFNVLLKSGQPFVYILFTKPTKTLPRIQLIRNKNKKGTYFGPFINKRDANSVFRYLVETFQLFLCNKKIKNGCLDFHLGMCAGLCLDSFDKSGYLFRLSLAQKVLKSSQKEIIKSLEEKIKLYTQNLEFEKAKQFYSYLENISLILSTIKNKFSQEKFFNEIFATTMTSDFDFDHLKGQEKEIADFLGLKKPIKTIDCFDVSHFQSQFIVGSCVRFIDGVPEKNKFRHFKIKTLQKQNDYAALQEIVKRRYKIDTSDLLQDLPDLILIDGGKGQLNAVQFLLPSVPFISLAKREETIFSNNFPKGKILDIKTKIARLFISLRDYAHHFAVSYHKLLRKKSY